MSHNQVSVITWFVCCRGLVGPSATALTLADLLCWPPLSGLLATGPGDWEGWREGWAMREGDHSTLSRRQSMASYTHHTGVG